MSDWQLHREQTRRWKMPIVPLIPFKIYAARLNQRTRVCCKMCRGMEIFEHHSPDLDEMELVPISHQLKKHVRDAIRCALWPRISRDFSHQPLDVVTSSDCYHQGGLMDGPDIAAGREGKGPDLFCNPPNERLEACSIGAVVQNFVRSQGYCYWRVRNREHASLLLLCQFPAVARHVSKHSLHCFLYADALQNPVAQRGWSGERLRGLKRQRLSRWNQPQKSVGGRFLRRR
ncbi:hypothetical protein B0T21DRAFT_12872 [Apiosordaria backusii]|uniref:Uncharacterized protein n=1 Tax=Apiosordaria backusii TaxID=314023 RepID=A0AA40EYJ6_9PEZI|nr:hypothetical protein B0T21DRAFT_12872 [Apiosordaria backusii]